MQATTMAIEPTLAILSGKGGTGKTLLSVNLASVAKEATYIDCDVEEPNGNLFFNPTQEFGKLVTVKKPVVDEALCDGCHKCVDFCAFNALALIGKHLMIFDEICHSCGGCIHVCPQKALSEQDRAVGEMSIGRSDSVRSISGSMNIGESSGVPIIEELLKHKGGDLTIIDAPPGSSCLVTESVRLADFCILIAEPTTFGAHNLAMVHELVSLLGKPYAVVLNKVMEGKNPAEEFCIKNNIPIIGRIPFDKKLGSLNSVGKIASREEKHYRELFASILSKALAKVNP